MSHRERSSLFDAAEVRAINALLIGCVGIGTGVGFFSFGVGHDFVHAFAGGFGLSAAVASFAYFIRKVDW